MISSFQGIEPFYQFYKPQTIAKPLATNSKKGFVSKGEDVLKSAYEKAEVKKEIFEPIKPDKNYEKHFILPNSRILLIGPSGAGKSSWLVHFLERKNEGFTNIFIFSASTTDQPIYNSMKKQNPKNVFLINDVNEIPPLASFENDKHNEKLIIFDDINALKPKELKEIEKYFIASRKYGFTSIVMAQNYVSVPKLISRNCDYIVMFRMNDNITIANIIRNHNLENVDNKVIKDMYLYATEKPQNFFMLDLNRNSTKERRFRKNFLEFLKPT